MTNLISFIGTSQVVQWSRIHLPINIYLFFFKDCIPAARYLKKKFIYGCTGSLVAAHRI